MNIAIPVWEGKVSPLFDTASRLLVFQTEQKLECSRFETLIDEEDITGKCLNIQKLGIDTLICGAISKHFYMMLRSVCEISVIPWISGRCEDVLLAYLGGSLNNTKYLMPGCRWEKGSSDNDEVFKERKDEQK